jgi:hypothetical protein
MSFQAYLDKDRRRAGETSLTTRRTAVVTGGASGIEYTGGGHLLRNRLT